MNLPQPHPQPEPRLDARQARSRAALNQALLGLLREKSFDQITIREISARAHTGYATFFRHYPSKEALLHDVAAAEIAALMALVSPILETADSCRLTIAICEFVNGHRAVWSSLLTGGASGILREVFIQQALELPREVDPVYRWLPTDLLISCLTGGVLDVLAWWLGRSPETPADEIAAIIDRLIVSPMLHRQTA
ncbi:MAG: TetR/AcrR family transcriptional regulator [Novosphingobium sp.]|nr:TetR/AcrR family transcriptional regulator [Novosphingobium sp.]